MRRIVLALVLAAAASGGLSAQTPAAAADAQRDSAFRAWVRATLVGAGVAEPRGLLLFEGLRSSGELQVRVLEGAFPDSALMRVYGEVQRRPDRWPGDALRLLVRVDADAFQGTPAPGPEGMPELQNGPEVANVIRAFAASHPGLGAAGQSVTAQVQTVVSRTGAVVFAMVVESSGNAEVDRFAAETALTMLFRPARSGTTPVDVWVTIPVEVAAPAR